MAGRRVAHRAETKRRWRIRRRRGRAASVAVIAVGALVVLGIAAWALVPRLLGRAPSCAATEEYTVLVDSGTLPAVNSAAARLDPAACVALRVDVAEQAAIAAKVASGKDAPDLWLADSSARVAGIAAADRPEIAVPSVASSPAVVVAAKGAAAPAGWAKTLEAQGLLIGDPLTSASAGAALAGSVAEGESGAADPKALAASLGRLTQSAAQKSRATLSDSALLDSAERSDSPVVVTESSWLVYASSRPDTKLAAAAPGGSAAVADYPIAVAGADPHRRAGAAEAAKALAAALADDAGRRALADHGLRPSGGAALDGAALDGAASTRSVGTFKVLAPSADGVGRALKTWALQAVPFRSLVVMDVSGSMNLDAGGTTRMKLTQEAATRGAALFPNTAALGMWAFSRNLGGEGQDYVELDPVRRMDQVAGGKTQRERLQADIAGLGSRVGGATGLYDTALAAYRTAKAGYDPLAVNSVILFTDGANEDPGSISLDQLLEALAREKDPAKPVIIVTIGITADADEPVLRQIAAATGGSSYVAKDPADIPKVFTEALVARAQ
jgi:hypothetical protein